VHTGQKSHLARKKNNAIMPSKWVLKKVDDSICFQNGDKYDVSAYTDFEKHLVLAFTGLNLITSIRPIITNCVTTECINV